MSIVTRSFLSPITFVWPGDSAIDAEKWTPEAAAEYTRSLIKGVQPPMPPEKPGEKCTRFTFAPLNYDAYVHFEHLRAASTYADPLEDPEVQQHVLRHTIRDLTEAYKVDEDERQQPITVETDHGPFGERVTGRCWSRDLIPFLDFSIRLAMLSLVVQFSVARLSRSLNWEG